MDDPWGSPWATDSPAKIDLPTAPQNAHFASEHLSPRRLSPGRSPWNDGEAWGGWNDGGGGGGKETPGWGRSPGLKPLKGSPSTRRPSPDPWARLSLGGLETTGLERGVSRRRRDSERSRDDRVVDSAISLGEGDGFQRDESLKDEIPALAPEPSLDLPEPLEERTTSISVTFDQLERPKSPDGQVGQILEVDRGMDTDEQPSMVPQLVGTYDEMSQRSASPDTALITAAKQPILVEARVEEEAADFPKPELADISRIDQDEASHKDGVSPLEDSESTPQQESQEHESHEVEPEKPTAHAPNAPPIPYPVDLTQLDHLFPSTKPVTTQPEPVPDVIIDDTFASTGERKAWYRMSRFGSLRKHTSGDDENYVRVGWAGSEVRDRTIKTVRRWMEEDSIAGRVVMGRRLGAAGASMFNWDSSAPPVEIGELLGRNGSHSRQTSLVRSPVVSPTAVSFGWTSSLPSSPIVARHPPATELPQTEPPTSETPRHLQSLERPPVHARAPIPPPIQPPNNIINAKEDEEDDDDDDWGEMVSSPVVANSGMASLSAVVASLDVAGTAVPSSHDSHEGATNIPFDRPLEATSTPPISPSFPPEPSESVAMPQAIPVNSTATTTIMAITESSIAMPEFNASDEETVAGILGNLPDLSYMLR